MKYHIIFMLLCYSTRAAISPLLRRQLMPESLKNKLCSIDPHLYICRMKKVNPILSNYYYSKWNYCTQHPELRICKMYREHRLLTTTVATPVMNPIADKVPQQALSSKWTGTKEMKAMIEREGLQLVPVPPNILPLVESRRFEGQLHSKPTQSLKSAEKSNSSLIRSNDHPKSNSSSSLNSSTGSGRSKTNPKKTNNDDEILDESVIAGSGDIFTV
ncbi:hypothetical protein WR25_18672 [Diploscapter pachys]|uniref:Uncharacterized protein n=1 Tax=Diploscapter pachys TaxID=2018661 RepID=A0A2A2JAE9_9BILA|nr:hypothetical protein WR25_18672 [Diploscapter pachys]